MTLVVTTYVPEGIVMASDSRQSITISNKDNDGKDLNIEIINSDSVTKIFLLEKQSMGISTFGQDFHTGIPMASYIRQFSEEIVNDTDDVETVARELVNFIIKDFGKINCGFHVCGYKKEEKMISPYVFHCYIGDGKVIRTNIDDNGSIIYGTIWGGQTDVLESLLIPIYGSNKEILRNAFPIKWRAMALQEAIDFSIFAINTTINIMKFQARFKSVGGAIDILIITPHEGKFIQKKKLSI